MPLEPLHNNHPLGIEATEPDHNKITPAGIISLTKAVVAIWVVFVPAVAVGANGAPVNVGEADNAILPVPVTELAKVTPP